MKNNKAFTLIELLVVIAIIALLLSIIMPALGKVKEAAKRVLCSSDVRQVGLGLSVYSEGNNSKMLPMTEPDGDDTDDAQPHWGVVAYNDEYRDSNGDMIPLHLAKLYDQGILDNPEIFYCPAQPRNPNYHLPYYYDAYTENGTKPWGTVAISSLTGDSSGTYCRTSYNYWTYNAKRLQDIPSYKAIMVDNVQEWEVLPHRKGNATSDTDPKGLSALYVDGHVSFVTDDRLWDDDVWKDKNRDNGQYGDGPGNDKEAFENILRVLDGQ